MTLEPRWREIRKSKNLRLVDVCPHLGISVSALAQIERNETMPKKETMAKAAVFFGCTLNDLYKIVEKPE